MKIKLAYGRPEQIHTCNLCYGNINVETVTGIHGGVLDASDPTECIYCFLRSANIYFSDQYGFSTLAVIETEGQEYVSDEMPYGFRTSAADNAFYKIIKQQA